MNDTPHCRPPMHSWTMDSAEFGATIPYEKPCECGLKLWTPRHRWDEEAGEMIQVFDDELRNEPTIRRRA